MNVTWKGVYPAITTKFNENDEIDYEAYEKGLQGQLDAGVDGIIVSGSLGEASTLSDQEKLDLTEHTVKYVNGKVPVIFSIAEQSTKVAVYLAEKALEKGASGLMILPPLRYSSSVEETIQYFATIAERTPLPIIIYNNPVDYKTTVTLDMFAELSKFDNIQAVKESTRDISNVTRMINRFGDRFKILCGVDPLALESLFMGADGWVAGLVDAFPKETVAIYRLAKAGRYEEALSIYRWFLPLLELDIDPKLVQNIKLAEVYTELGTENVRAPRLPLSGKNRERVIKVIEDSLATRPELPEGSWGRRETVLA
ncbi:dihydrodipicolinate synthase family protein [Desertivirga arenae]|uniref:dihydrodipicolinate synthase family protein n=1 Tax=Desertivirga arenae TaxID=2810309 RepID=UPI001F61FFA9|nr:dihydrodipicolinate synthase family protein [Pedobacter sp. SYSU D00823]